MKIEGAGHDVAMIRDSKSLKKNPLVIYNPSRARLLYGRAWIPEARGIKTDGKYKGERFKHKFSKNTSMKIFGLPDGSLLIKSNDGKRLWADEKDVNRFDKS